MKNQLSERINLPKTLGCVVEYEGEKFLFWDINSSCLNQLIKPDGTKFSDTPESNKLTWLYQLPLVRFNNSDYVVDVKQRIISLATGNICSFTPEINANLIKEAAQSPIVDIRVKYNMGLITWDEFYMQTASEVNNYFESTWQHEESIF